VIRPRRALTCLAAAVVLGSSGCRSARRSAATEPCAAPGGTLAADARADGLVGPFRLVFVAATGPRAGERVEGALTLMRADTVHYGMTDVALDGVGAVESGALDAASPEAPGVRVFAVPGNIMLRLGADANRLDQIRIEGSYTVLRVRQLTPDGFRGVWVSGATQEVATGWFCATRSR
jgi:hypothetical protein